MLPPSPVYSSGIEPGTLSMLGKQSPSGDASVPLLPFLVLSLRRSISNSSERKYVGTKLLLVSFFLSKKETEEASCGMCT